MLFILAVNFKVRIINYFNILLPKNQVTPFLNLNYFLIQYFLDELELYPSLLNFHSKFAIAASLPKNPCLSH